MRRTAWLIAGSLLAILAGWGIAQLWQGPAGQPAAGPGSFLDRHWQDPLPPQGPPPDGYTPLEASLGAGACRSCHPRQYGQWQGSLHSETMGPGIWWQFRVKTPEQVKACMRCHGPLAEQKARVAQELGWETAPSGPAPDFVPADLHRQGVACSVCHVRKHQRFGPPAKDPLPADRAPHNGFTAEGAFRESRFCAECHQFAADGPTLNGKLRQDTHREWQASEYAERGVSCQDCHMPGGDHTWRGIHDPGMVRQAVSMEVAVSLAESDRLRVRGRITNTGAGHKLPTYTTPRLTARLLLVDASGAVRRVLDTAEIAWKADVEMTREIYDTRLAPGEGIAVSAPLDRPPGPGWEAVLRLDVAPRHHYERLFRYMFRQSAKMDAATLEALTEALKEAQATRFQAGSVTQALPAASE